MSISCCALPNYSFKRNRNRTDSGPLNSGVIPQRYGRGILTQSSRWVASSAHCHVVAYLTQSHMDYVIEVMVKVFAERDQLPAYRIVEQAPFLRHFSAKLEPVK